LILCFHSFLSVEEDLQISVSNKGAELTSIKYKGKEYLHDESKFWDRKSPILFPIVGRLLNGTTIIDGKEYHMDIHGFGMDLNFQEIGKYQYMATSNEETLTKYPFEFDLYISYSIDKNKLKYNYTVFNKNSKTMLFGIGGHPGFKCNYFEEKSSIEFEEEENNIKVIPIILPQGLMNNETEDGNNYIKNKKTLDIKKDTFKNDAIVFTDIKSKSVFLKDDGKKILKFNFEGFKYLGIWSAEGNAPFICIEPWYDPPDYIDSNQKFEEKKDIVRLEPNKAFTVEFSVEFFDGTNHLKSSYFISLLIIICLL
jgi:galactose mutarotase-like enzyme